MEATPETNRHSWWRQQSGRRACEFYPLYWIDFPKLPWRMDHLHCRRRRRVGECDINITLGVMTCLRASLSLVNENLYLRSPYANNFINPRRFQICLGGNVAGQVCLRAAWCELVCEFRDKEKSCQIIVIILHVFLLSNHKKKKSLRKLTAPGTANRITRLFAVNSLMLILLAGESSNKSTDGTWSPSWKRRKFVKFRRIFKISFQN